MQLRRSRQALCQRSRSQSSCGEDQVVVRIGDCLCVLASRMNSAAIAIASARNHFWYRFERASASGLAQASNNVIYHNPSWSIHRSTICQRYVDPFEDLILWWALVVYSCCSCSVKIGLREAYVGSILAKQLYADSSVHWHLSASLLASRKELRM